MCTWQVMVIWAGAEPLFSPTMAASCPTRSQLPWAGELGHPGPFLCRWICCSGAWTPSSPNTKASRRIWKVQEADSGEHYGGRPGLQSKTSRELWWGACDLTQPAMRPPQAGTCQHEWCTPFISSQDFGQRTCPPVLLHPAHSRGWSLPPRSPPFHFPSQHLGHFVPVFLAALGQKQSQPGWVLLF